MEVSLRRNVANAQASTVIRQIYRNVAQPTSSKQQLERERRLRRQIANNNERKRMQSINHGFDRLKSLLHIQEADKFVSKSSLLESTAQHIEELYEERNQLISEIKNLRQFIRERLGIDPSLISEINITSQSEDEMQESNEIPISSSSETDGTHDRTNVVESYCAINSVDSGLSFGIQDNLDAPENLVNSNKLRARSGSGHNQLGSEQTIEVRQENSLTFGDPAGRNNLEIILTAIQHIESNTISSHDNNATVNFADQSAQISTTTSSNGATPVGNGVRRQTVLLHPIPTTDATNHQRHQQLHRIPTILLHPVSSSNSANKFGNGSKQQFSAPSKSTSTSQITSNIVVLNRTVTLTGADGGEMQYHLAAVTNK